MANRLDQAFAGCKKLLCPFLTAGYPSVAATPALLLAAQAGGAGVIELGIPFSDPVADGPVIQASYTHALAGGTTVKASIEAVSAARKQGLTVPVVAMVSFSIVYKRGSRAFAELCAANGVDGVILPDVPLEEAPAAVAAFRDHALRTCLLVAPTTPGPRREAIAKLCDGFVYYLSVSGITGERKALPPDIGANIGALRAVSKAPICVGFGISTAEQVKQVTQTVGADGAIVGSALIRQITAHVKDTPQQQAEAVRAMVADLAGGLTT
jgi:tryptophan synthase alpha chain